MIEVVATRRFALGPDQTPGRVQIVRHPDGTYECQLTFLGALTVKLSRGPKGHWRHTKPLLPLDIAWDELIE